MQISIYIKPLILSLTTTLFLACGGGSDSKSEDNSTNQSTTEIETAVKNQKPIANAGDDRNITFGSPIILDASQSSDPDGSITQYQWKQENTIISDQESVILDKLEEGSYTFTLTVTDDKNATHSTSIKLMTYADTIVVFKTNQGDIELKMISDVAPKAVENFVTHSRNGYYDGTIFHRVIKDFMIQGGDPDGTGYGGESIWGGEFKNEISSTLNFDRPFLLAMGNKGNNHSNGSQFFITVENFEFGNGKYTIFGEVISGKDVVTKIENTSTQSNSKPINNQVILDAYIKFEVK